MARRMDQRVARWLARYSIVALRVSLGLVILGFGALKLIPGASPAEDLVMRTVDTLTFGVITGQSAVLVTAVTEVVIGAILISGRFLRVGLLVVAGWLLGIMSPLVLFFSDMFPAGGPTLEAQYVLKDIVLGAAALVVAARAMGARLTLPN
jgi:putative oxidoreductase